MVNRIVVGCCALWGLVACGNDAAPGSGSAGGGAGAAASTGGKAATSTGGKAAAGTDDDAAAGTDDDAAAGTAGDAAAGTAGLPHYVGSCDALAPAGTWEEITPPEVSLEADFKTPAGDNFGDHSFVIDPQDTAHVYLGTSAQGIYESKDCGATWRKINTGRNADKLDSGRQWTFVIDPVDPQVLYTNAGYGQSNAWKSSNGGVDWDELIDPAYAAALQFGGFVHSITLDPTDHRHLIVTPHFECEIGKGPGGLPLTKGCLLETPDAGGTWTIKEGTPTSGEGGGEWMVDSKLWFWSEWFGGLWRTGNAGETWEHVWDQGYASSSGFALPGHDFFVGGVFGVLHSEDSKTWTSLDGAPGVDVLAGDATILFGARGAYYWSTAPGDPRKWTSLPSPPFEDPNNTPNWGIKWDADHRLLYSLNSRAGFWRMVVE